MSLRTSPQAGVAIRIPGIHRMPSLHWSDKLKFDHSRNDTELRERVTIGTAPVTNCHRALRGKLKYVKNRKTSRFEMSREVLFYSAIFRLPEEMVTR